MKTDQEKLTEILKSLQDKPVEELAGYDLKRDWWRETEVDPWRLMCWYKKDKSPAGNCDASLRAMVLFWLVFGFDEWTIRPRSGQEGNYQLEREGVGYAVRGDTMNSYATTAHAYLRMKRLEAVRGNRTWYDAILEDYDAFAPLYKGPFARFVESCHTVGNLLPIPSGGFNSARGLGPTRDYFDLFLIWLFEYMERPEFFQYVAFTGDIFPGVHQLQWFLCTYDGFDDYIRRNLLEEFSHSCVQNEQIHFVEGLPLWPGHRFGSILPQNAEECETFFQNASERISARGARIVTAAKERLAAYDGGGLSMEALAEKMLGTE